MNRLLRGVDPVVCWGSAGVIFAFVLWGILGPESLGAVMGDVLGWIIGNFGWAFILIAVGALAMCVFMVIHPWGRIRLGPDDSRPEFSTVSWIAMMFAAGESDEDVAQRFLREAGLLRPLGSDDG
jgi:glycine betaine transporter